MEDLFRLHHEVSGDTKEHLLLDADVFIQTSRFEGMPLGVLEALGYGLPCLVTEGTNLAKEISAHHAGWNGGGTAKEIAEKLLKAMAERDRFNEYGERGRLFVKEFFSWDVIGKKAVEGYRNLIG